MLMERLLTKQHVSEELIIENCVDCVVCFPSLGPQRLLRHSQHS